MSMEPVLIHQTKGFSAGGATCDRSIFWDGNKHGVVFSSNYESIGRSITNVFETLCNSTLSEFPGLSADNVTWYEYRRIAVTRDGYKQNIPTFSEVTFASISTKGELQLPQWIPHLTDESFGTSVQNIVNNFRKKIVRG